jgi:hypothetical protein
MARKKNPADPTIRQALAQDWRRRLQRATRLGKRADVRKEWLKDREWRRDPAKVEAVQRDGFPKAVQQALAGREHWLHERVEARKAEPPQPPPPPPLPPPLPVPLKNPRGAGTKRKYAREPLWRLREEHPDFGIKRLVRAYKDATGKDVSETWVRKNCHRPKPGSEGPPGGSAN